MKHLTFILLFFFAVASLNAQTFTQVGHAKKMEHPVAFQNKLFFLSEDDTNGEGLFYIDGVSQTMQFVASVIGNTSKLVESNGKLFFIADDGSHGYELWATDGTTANTAMVKDIAQGFAASVGLETELISYKGKLYFAANDGTNGEELWLSDGTAGGTSMVTDLAPGGTSGITYPGPKFRIFEGRLFFFGRQGLAGDELWATDGTTANTQPQFLFVGGFHKNATEFAGRLWAQVENSSTGKGEVYAFDSAAAVPVRVHDSFPNKSVEWEWYGEGMKFPFFFDGKLMIGASNAGVFDSVRYFLTDGQAYVEILADMPAKHINEAAEVGNKLVFVNTDGFMYASDLLNPVVALLPNVDIGGIGLKAINGRACFSRNDNFGMEPWVTDGTLAGTQRLKDIGTGSADGLMTGEKWETVFYNGNLYFSGPGISNFWRTDGTANGTVQVSAPTDTFLTDISFFNKQYVVFSGCLYVYATGGNLNGNWNYGIWRYCDSGLDVSDAEREEHVRVFPNPASSEIQIEAEHVKEVRISNSSGITVASFKTPGYNRLPIHSLSPGMYVVEVRMQHSIERVRFMKM